MKEVKSECIQELMKLVHIVAYKKPNEPEMCHVDAVIGDFVISRASCSSHEVGDDEAFASAEKEVSSCLVHELIRLEDYRLTIELINGWSGEVN